MKPVQLLIAIPNKLKQISTILASDSNKYKTYWVFTGFEINSSFDIYSPAPLALNKSS
jgi:hypothetical protein